MATVHRLSRRMFLTDFGRRTFAVTILGAAVVACSSEDEEEGEGAAGTTAGTTTGPDGSTTSGPSREPLRWEQVSLGFVSAYVLVRGTEAAVVDTGTAGSAPQIQAALANLGADWSDVDHLLLTHLHPDHIGSVGDVLAAADSAVAYAGEADIEGISSPRPLRPVGDGDEVFGLRVIATPGHTAGHISVFDTETGLLVAGDALVTQEGAIVGSNPDFTSDQAAADASVHKLAALGAEAVAAGHGDPIEHGAGPLLDDLAATL